MSNDEQTTADGDAAIADANRYDGAIPRAEVREARSLSLFWLIPLIAALIAAWLVWEAHSTRGPEITIVFKHGEGIEAGKTTIRYKAVEIGQVLTTQIAPDLKSIAVRARINLDFAGHLTTNTRFWVVRPRVGAQGISGLSTLVSGAYIEIDPASGPATRHFTALDTPPIVSSDAPGRAFLLRADQLGNIQPGSRISYKDIEVGEVLGYELADRDNGVEIHIFIREPYARLVRENSRFWLVSGLNLAIGADGLEFHTPSLQEILLGGIEFDAPPGDERPAARAGEEFRLFENADAIAEAGFTEEFHYVMYFDESVRGLSSGAPVEFRGIKLGEVAAIKLEIDETEHTPQIPVVIKIHPQRFATIDRGDAVDGRSLLQPLLERGLRARLQTANLLTGQLYVELSFEPNEPAKFVTGRQNLPQIPTLRTEFGAFKNNASALLAELRDFPLEKLGDSAVGALNAVEQRLEDPQIDRAVRAATASFTAVERLSGEFERNLAPLRKDLAAAMATLKADSPLQTQLQETLRQVDAAARAVRELSNELERQPQSVIWGKKDAKDE